MAAEGRLSVKPMITIGNLCFFLVSLRTVDIIHFLSSVGFISPRTALSKTSGMSQNIGVASFQKEAPYKGPLKNISPVVYFRSFTVFYKNIEAEICKIFRTDKPEAEISKRVIILSVEI